MKLPSIHPEGLKKAKAWEWAVRFVFGGTVTALTGIVAHHFGPAVGGLFLAFPAILPASLTLVKQHDGRSKAAEDASGAILGAVALLAFAGVVLGTAAAVGAPLVLGLALVAWALASGALWFVVHGMRKNES